MIKAQNIETFIYQLPPNRQLLANKLLEKDWFKNTDFNIQKQVLELPDDHEGFVFDLSKRTDNVGSLKVLKLHQLNKGNFTLTPIFEVLEIGAKKSFFYEYVSWKMGPFPGVKGVLLIQTNNQISHFIVLEAEKFAPSCLSYDTLGGLIFHSNTEFINLPQRIESTIKDQLGIDKISINNFLDLGHLSPDNGLTNNHPSIFAAVIDGDKSTKINTLHSQTFTTKKVNFKLNIVPISELSDYISKVDDAFFLSVICRLFAKKIISL